MKGGTIYLPFDVAMEGQICGPLGGELGVAEGAAHVVELLLGAAVVSHVSRCHGRGSKE